MPAGTRGAVEWSDVLKAAREGKLDLDTEREASSSSPSSSSSSDATANAEIAAALEARLNGGGSATAATAGRSARPKFGSLPSPSAAPRRSDASTPSLALLLRLCLPLRPRRSLLLLRKAFAGSPRPSRRRRRWLPLSPPPCAPREPGPSPRPPRPSAPPPSLLFRPLPLRPGPRGGAVPSRRGCSSSWR